MKKFKGTKGDWSYSKETGTIRGDGGLLAELLINGLEDDNGIIMAAAPDLLEALQDMLSGWKYIREQHGDLYGVGWDRAQDKAQAAISKALGEE